MAYSKRSRYSPSLSPYEKDRGRSVSRSLSRSRSRSISSDAENPGNSLYVTGLSHRVTARDLEDYFSKEGEVIDVHLVLDPRTRESRGFGFVSMENVDDANRCIRHLDHTVLQGRVITVEKARRRRGRTPTPGKYLGLRTSRGSHRSRSYSPSGRRSRSYSSDRSSSYSPSYRRSRRSSYSPYHRRSRSYSSSRSRSPDDRYYPRHDRSYSPYYRRRDRDRSYSPYYRGRDRSYSPYYRGRDRSYSPYYRGRDRSYSPYDRYSRYYRRRSSSRSISAERRKSRSKSKEESQSSMLHSRSGRSSSSRSLSPP